MKINPVRGTHDLFGEEINKFNKVVAEVIIQIVFGLKLAPVLLSQPYFIHFNYILISAVILILQQAQRFYLI